MCCKRSLAEDGQNTRLLGRSISGDDWNIFPSSISAPVSRELSKVGAPPLPLSHPTSPPLSLSLLFFSQRRVHPVPPPYPHHTQAQVLAPSEPGPHGAMGFVLSTAAPHHKEVEVPLYTRPVRVQISAGWGQNGQRIAQMCTNRFYNRCKVT